MASKTLEILLIAKDEATKIIRGMSGSLRSLADDAKIGATVMAGGLTIIGKNAIEAGNQFQQARIALNTMTGSTKIAGNLLQKLSDFAIKTPFTLPDVLENSKMLMAMGSTTENVIPELKMLGDVSAGLSVPLSRLALNFGQVRTIGHLTGRELRDFSTAGVPLLETLSKSLGKTKAEIADMVSNGDISFDMVNKAFIDMTSNGGKFTDMMINQSGTLKGRLSNVSDAMTRMGAAMLGVTTQGEVLKGGLFDIVSNGLLILMDTLNAITPSVALFFSQITSNMPIVVTVIGALLGLLYPIAAAFVTMIAPALAFVGIGAGIGLVIGALIGGFRELNPFMVGFGIALLTLAAMVFSTFIPAITAAIGVNYAWLTSTLAAFAPFITIAVVLGGVVAGLMWLMEQIRLYIDVAYQSAVTTRNLQRAKEDLKTATENLANAEDNTRAAMNRLETANLAVERSQIIYTDAVKKHGPKSLEAREASNRLKLAQDGVKTANDDVTTATQKEMEMQTKAIAKHKDVEKSASGVKSAFDGIRDAISGAIGKLAEWISKGSGGGGGAPHFQHGGFVSGSFDQAVPAILHGGERVVPRNGVDVNSGGGGGGGVNLSLNFSGPVNMDSDSRVQELADKIIDILGRQNELASRGLAI